MKVLLLGDTGSLGSEFRQLFSNKKVHFYCINRKKKNLSLIFQKLKNLIFKQKTSFNNKLHRPNRFDLLSK